MTEGLKPCPFCGGEAKLACSPNIISPHVYCKNCLMTDGRIHDDPDDAIDAWNQRKEHTCTYDRADGHGLICSHCGWNRRGALIIPNYCPHCGYAVENASAPEDYEKYHRFEVGGA